MIAKYQALPEKERTDRLRATELYFLMKKTPAERQPYFPRVPASDLAFFQDRLKYWDGLPEELRQEPLVIEHFLQIENASPRTQPAAPSQFTEELRVAIAKMQSDLSSIPELQRTKISSGFQQFLDLPDAEKVKTLSRFSPEERQRVEVTLKALAKLSPPQRTNAIVAFQKLTSMESKDRDEFLLTAAHWKAMTAEERATWLSLMRIIPGGLPPLPGTLPPMPMPNNLPGLTTPGTQPALPEGGGVGSAPPPPGTQ